MAARQGARSMQFLLLARNAFACVWLACLAAQAPAAQTHLDVLSIDLNSRIHRVAALTSRIAVDEWGMVHCWRHEHMALRGADSERHIDVLPRRECAVSG